ncbi:peptidylprolyl isomerase [Celerinatantimonas sp. YJH-8]|uniref:peptidylprolyl isomerase n=1 Tax=Celerinatantimonas sp. YJH-8 TaxID=3228714 RepID=UPI0038BE8140
MIKQELRYPLLRFSLTNYGCAPEFLSAQQLDSLLIQVSKAQQIEIQVAHQSKVAVSAAQIKQAREELTSQFNEPAAFEQALCWLELSDELLKSGLIQALQAESALNQVRRSVEAPSSAQLRHYYDIHPEKFYRPAQVRVRHILRTLNDEYEENRREMLVPWMQEKYQALQKQPERFIEMAEQYSECPSAMQGGLIGAVSQGQLYPELDAVAFAMRDGEISEPIESPMGFHILLCEAHIAPSERSFDDVKEALAQQLYQKLQKQAERRWVASIMANQPILES